MRKTGEGKKFSQVFKLVNLETRVSAAEKRRLKMDQAADDGAFWMTFKDWVDEFEILTICALPGLDLEDEDGKITKE